MGAAIKRPFSLDAMADDLAIAMLTPRRERVDRAFEAVEIMRFAMNGDFHRLVVIVSANFTFLHINSLSVGDMPPPPLLFIAFQTFPRPFHHLVVLRLGDTFVDQSLNVGL